MYYTPKTTLERLRMFAGPDTSYGCWIKEKLPNRNFTYVWVTAKGYDDTAVSESCLMAREREAELARIKEEEEREAARKEEEQRRKEEEQRRKEQQWAALKAREDEEARRRAAEREVASRSARAASRENLGTGLLGAVYYQLPSSFCRDRSVSSSCASKSLSRIIDDDRQKLGQHAATLDPALRLAASDA